MSILIEEGLEFCNTRLASAVESDFSNATDVAYYLVAKGIPFREAYQTVGGVVKRCIEDGVLLRDLEIDEWQQINPLFAEDLYDKLSPKHVVDSRVSEGGTGFRRVKERLKYWKEVIAS